MPTIDLKGNKVVADSFDGASVNSNLAVTKLTGTMTGTTDGAMADVTAATAATTDTTAASLTSTNAAITATNLQLKELQVKLNALIDALKGV